MISIGKSPNGTRAVKRSNKLSNGCKIEGCDGAKSFEMIIKKARTTVLKIGKFHSPLV